MGVIFYHQYCCMLCNYECSLQVVNCTQAYVMKYLLLLTFIGTMWVSSTQGQRGDFVLRFSRPVSNFPNRILMECRDSFDDTLVPEPNFFRNGLPFSLPNRMDISLGVRFDVDRTAEGNFTCGVEGRTSTPPMTIVSKYWYSEFHVDILV